MSDTPSDEPSPSTADDATPPPAAADDASPADGETSEGTSDIPVWKFAVVIGVVVVLVVGGLGVYRYRNRIFKTSSTTSSTTQGAGGAVLDNFDREDRDSLGTAPSGQVWKQVVGKWGIANHDAVVVTPNDKGPRNIAVVDTKSGDGTVASVPGKLGDGWGMVFRYKSPQGYWRLYWDTGFKSFHLVKFENDKETNAVPGGFASPKDPQGTTVAVEFKGSTITVLVDNAPIKTVTDSYLQDQTMAGMFVTTDSYKDSSWTNFSANGSLAGPVRTAPDKPVGTQAGSTRPSTG